MPIDAADLFSSFHSLHLFPPYWAGVALRSMSTFVHCASGREALHSLLLIVFRLILLCTIAANLGCVILSADVTIIVAPEVLLYSIGAVVELVLIYLAFPGISRIDDSVSHF